MVREQRLRPILKRTQSANVATRGTNTKASPCSAPLSPILKITLSKRESSVAAPTSPSRVTQGIPVDVQRLVRDKRKHDKKSRSPDRHSSLQRTRSLRPDEKALDGEGHTLAGICPSTPRSKVKSNCPLNPRSATSKSKGRRALVRRTPSSEELPVPIKCPDIVY